MPLRRTSRRWSNEEARIRVVRLRMAPNTVLPMHDRPARVVIPLTPNDVRITRADGTPSTTRTEAHRVAWSEPTRRTVMNLDSALENIIVELKNAKEPTKPVAQPPSPAPPDFLDEPRHRWLFENQYVRVYDVRIQPGEITQIPPPCVTILSRSSYPADWWLCKSRTRRGAKLKRSSLAPLGSAPSQRSRLHIVRAMTARPRTTCHPRTITPPELKSATRRAGYRARCPGSIVRVASLALPLRVQLGEDSLRPGVAADGRELGQRRGTMPRACAGAMPLDDLKGIRHRASRGQRAVFEASAQRLSSWREDSIRVPPRTRHIRLQSRVPGRLCASSRRSTSRRTSPGPSAGP